MGKIHYNLDVMKFMSLFEKVTHARIKDCIQMPERLMFIVQQGEMGKAIGKQGSNLHRLETMLKKKIKVVEFNEDCKQFIQSYIHPLKVREIQEEDDIITITGPDTKTKGLLIGRDRQNLKALKEVVERFFPIKDIKVV